MQADEDMKSPKRRVSRAVSWRTCGSPVLYEAAEAWERTIGIETPLAASGTSIESELDPAFMRCLTGMDQEYSRHAQEKVPVVDITKQTVFSMICMCTLSEPTRYRGNGFSENDSDSHTVGIEFIGYALL